MRDYDLVACVDVDPSAAGAVADRYGLRTLPDLDELLADANVDGVLNLTAPQAHADVSRAALGAAKHVYTEKPLAARFTEAAGLVEEAARSGVLIGSAPDTFMGAGIQTCRSLVDEGAIGEPVAASAFWSSHGPRRAFFYEKGAGPLFDMGPYYLTALVTLLGAVASVSAMAKVSFPERILDEGADSPLVVRPEVPTHVSGLLEFVGGEIVGLTTSFDVWATEMPRIEIYGSEGTLSVPDPNTFSGPVRIFTSASGWREIPLTRPYASGQNRGLGIADLAVAARTGRAPRASGALALHVIEVLETLVTSARSGRLEKLGTTCGRPSPMAASLEEGDME